MIDNWATPEEVEKLLLCMSVLDSLTLPKEEAWLRLTRFEQLADVRKYTIDNGSGDHLAFLFSETCALIKGFDHENDLNQFAAQEWDVSFFENLYSGAPADLFALLDEEERDEATFCLWTLPHIQGWFQNAVPTNDGGRDYLLGYVQHSPESWQDWAQHYYEHIPATETIQAVYSQSADQLTHMLENL